MIAVWWLLAACGGLSSPPMARDDVTPAAPAAPPDEAPVGPDGAGDDDPFPPVSEAVSEVPVDGPRVRLAAPPAPPSLEPLDVGEARFRPLDPADGPLKEQLAAFRARAAAEGRRAYAQLTSEGCPACVELRQHLDDPRMTAAFGAVDVAWVEVRSWSAALQGDMWGESLDVPAFYVIAEDGTVGRRITGHAWAENVPENMAGPLADYFRAEE